MNILIVGCGIVGSDLCNKLSQLGHDISVIGESHEEFNMLSQDFSGYTTVGVAIDQDVLKNAGIESCDAVAAVTADDNMNLMIVQLAREFFHVPHAYARVNNPIKSDLFQKMEVETICPTKMTAETFISALTGQKVYSNVTLGNHSMLITEIDIEKKMIGKRLSELQLEDNETIIAIQHENNTVKGIFLTNYELSKGDKLICAKFIN